MEVAKTGMHVQNQGWNLRMMGGTIDGTGILGGTIFVSFRNVTPFTVVFEIELSAVLVVPDGVLLLLLLPA